MFHEASPQCILTTVLYTEKFILFAYYLDKLGEPFSLCIEKCNITDYRRVEVTVHQGVLINEKTQFLRHKWYYVIVYRGLRFVQAGQAVIVKLYRLA